MIEIVNAHLETRLQLSDSFVQLLVIENPSEYYKTVCELSGEFNGGEGNYIFVSDGDIIPPHSAGDIITDIFGFEFNDKKILNLLYKYLEANYLKGDGIVKFNEVSSAISGFWEDLFSSAAFTLEYSELEPIDLFKTCSVKFAKTYDTLIEKIICYINVLAELKRCKYVVFIGLKSVLFDDELLSLYEHCEREHIGLLLIENTKQRPLLPRERAVIITTDLCEILENYPDI